MSRVPLDALPEELTLEEAVAAAYPEQLTELASALGAGARVLLEVEPELMPWLHRALATALAAGDPPLRARYLAGAPARARLGPLELELHATPTAALARELREHLAAGDLGAVGVVAHFELLAAPGPEGEVPRAAHELRALLADHPEARLLALHAPDVAIAELIASRFVRGSVGPLETGRLPRLITRLEARKLDVSGFDPEALAEAIGGMDAVTLRRALVALRSRVDTARGDERGRAAVLSDLARLARPLARPAAIPPASAGARELRWVLRGPLER